MEKTSNIVEPKKKRKIYKDPEKFFEDGNKFQINADFTIFRYHVFQYISTMYSPCCLEMVENTIREFATNEGFSGGFARVKIYHVENRITGDCFCFVLPIPKIKN